MLFFKNWLAIAAFLMVGGCSTLSPYSTLTKMDLSLTASDQLNPDLNGLPSPMVVRLIELKHPAAFQRESFFSLWQSSTSLAEDLVNLEEVQLRPGERISLKLRMSSSSQYLGVLAAYRDLPETKWRYVIQVPAGEQNSTDLLLNHSGIHRIGDTVVTDDRS